MKRLIIFLEMVLFCCFSFSQRKIAIPELSFKDVSISDSIRKIVLESKCFENFKEQAHFYGNKFYLSMDCAYNNKEKCIKINIFPLPKYIKNKHAIYEIGDDYDKINGFFYISNFLVMVSGYYPKKFFTIRQKHYFWMKIPLPYYYDVPSWVFIYMGNTFFLQCDQGCGKLSVDPCQ